MGAAPDRGWLTVYVVDVERAEHQGLPEALHEEVAGALAGRAIRQHHHRQGGGDGEPAHNLSRRLDPDEPGIAREHPLDRPAVRFLHNSHPRGIHISRPPWWNAWPNNVYAAV